jgi:hypothetical protein
MLLSGDAYINRGLRVFNGETAADCSLPCGVHTIARLDDVPHIHRLNVLRIEFCAADNLRDYSCAEISCGGALESSV